MIDREKGHVVLQWTNPEKEAASYQIYRRENEKEFLLHKTIEANVNEWADKLLKINTKYTYFIITLLNDRSSSHMSKSITIQY